MQVEKLLKSSKKDVMTALTGVVTREVDRSKKIPIFDKTWNLKN